MRRLVRALLTAWLLGWLAFAGPAQATQIFFTNGISGTIARINGDSSGLTTILSGLSGPGAMAVDPLGRKLYWVDGIGEVQRANLDGSGLQTIYHTYNTFSAGGLAIDPAAGKLYISVYGYGDPGTVMRLNLDGSGLVTLPIAGLYNIGRGIAVDPAADGLYVVDGSTILRTNLAGTDTPQLVFNANLPPAIDEAHKPELYPLALDAALGRLFFYQEIIAGERTVSSIATGGGVETTLMNGIGTTLGLALDLTANRFFVTDAYAGSIRSAGFDGGAPALVLSGQTGLGGIAVLASIPEPAGCGLFAAALGLLAALRRPGRRST